MAKYLIPDKITSMPNGLSVKVKIIPDGLRATKKVASYINKGDLMKPHKSIGVSGKPLGVTIHNTPDIKTAKDTNPAEQYMRATYNGNMSGAVPHYYIYKEEIWQLLSDFEQGWHAGDKANLKLNHKGNANIGGNLDTIAIEIIGDDPASTVTGAKLAAALLSKHDLNPKDDLYTHQFWSGKYCPAYILPFWAAFAKTVEKYYYLIKPTVTPKPKQRFSDVPPDFWGAEAINALTEQNIINGYPDSDLFKPNQPATRAEVAQMIYKVLNK